MHKFHSILAPECFGHPSLPHGGSVTLVQEPIVLGPCMDHAAPAVPDSCPSLTISLVGFSVDEDNGVMGALWSLNNSDPTISNLRIMFSVDLDEGGTPVRKYILSIIF